MLDTINDFYATHASIVLPLLALGCALFEWFVPYPYFIRCSRLIKPLCTLGQRIHRSNFSAHQAQLAGTIMALLIAVTAVVIIVLLKWITGCALLIDLLVLLLIIESRPPRAINTRVSDLLATNNRPHVEEARDLLSRIVLRNTTRCSNAELIVASCENITLRLFTCFFVPLFYFLTFNIEVACAVKLITLCAMSCSCKLPYNANFGIFSHKLSQICYAAPAALFIAIIFVLQKAHKANIIKTIIMALTMWPVKVSGIVLASVAGALNITVGGTRYYLLTQYNYPVLGNSLEQPIPEDIIRTRNLTATALWIALVVVALIIMLFGIF